MFKILFSVTLLFCLNANAASLDQMLNQQTVTTISPVEMNGLYVLSSEISGASGICSMFGYTRLVSFSTKMVKVISNDKAVSVKFPPTGTTPYFEVEGLNRWTQISVFESVTCAR